MKHNFLMTINIPKAALIPPWAATVCDLVGNNFVTTAVLKPSWTRPKAARRPAPPAPMTNASCWWSITVYALVMFEFCEPSTEGFALATDK